MKINKIKSIKGVNSSTLYDIRCLFGVNLRKKNQLDLSYNGILRIKKYLRVKKVASLLKTIIKKRILNYISIKAYKGMRHKKGYPIHGQRTHTNAKTQKKISNSRLN